MGRHRRPSDWSPPEEELAWARIRGRRRARAVQEVGSRWTRWFKGDWWWLAGFTLGFCTGALLLWAGFLLWLTGDIVQVFRQLIGKG